MDKNSQEFDVLKKKLTNSALFQLLGLKSLTRNTILRRDQSTETTETTEKTTVTRLNTEILRLLLPYHTDAEMSVNRKWLQSQEEKVALKSFLLGLNDTEVAYLKELIDNETNGLLDAANKRLFSEDEVAVAKLKVDGLRAIAQYEALPFYQQSGHLNKLLHSSQPNHQPTVGEVKRTPLEHLAIDMRVAPGGKISRIANDGDQQKEGFNATHAGMNRSKLTTVLEGTTNKKAGSRTQLKKQLLKAFGAVIDQARNPEELKLIVQNIRGTRAYEILNGRTFSMLSDGPTKSRQLFESAISKKSKIFEAALKEVKTAKSAALQQKVDSSPAVSQTSVIKK